MMWQCQTNRPAMSNRALMRVISPGSATTVSLNPVSHASGGRGGPSVRGAPAPPNERRSSTWNCTTCTWIGWASSVKLRNSQISVALRRGFSVTGAIHGNGTGVPSALTVPSIPSVGASSNAVEVSSLRDSRRVTLAGPIGRIAGSRSRSGGTLRSAVVAAVTTNFSTCPVVPGSAGSKSVPTSPPPNGSSGPSLMRYSAVPTASPVKSTMTSRRSATPSRADCNGTGAGRNPPSVPMTQMGNAALAGRVASGSPATFNSTGRVAGLGRRPGQHAVRQVGRAAAQQVHAEQAGVDVQPGQAQFVAVEPQRGGALVVAVVEDRAAGGPGDPVAGHGLRAEPLVEGADAGEAARDVARHRQVPRLGVPVVLLEGVRAVQVGDERYRSPVRAGGTGELGSHVPSGVAAGRVGPVQRGVDRQQVRAEVAAGRDELVGPAHPGGAVDAGLDGEGGGVEGGRIADPPVPEHRRGGQSGRQDPLVELAGGDLVQLYATGHPAARHGGQHEQWHDVLRDPGRVEGPTRHGSGICGLAGTERGWYQQRSAADGTGPDELASCEHDRLPVTGSVAKYSFIEDYRHKWGEPQPP